MESQEQVQCIICSQLKRDGIHICTSFICTDCESELVRTDVLDDKYSFFIKQMRQIVLKKNA
ncbi:inhibitor of sigma-G Gin [Xylanibacillus composti]|uniref:Inhibitor of sigma-G Gin n=1 Tax=Xylanibacillus composti TaxID=1572762 RepID=A0A8J4H1Y7_9BACL|nr:sigma factor G inhibitor Gin [Xylanibacillus composti]MDT9725174.1 inhibitor of sigma-G Gin [Xylanibacillus composti]GIQ67253.1 hypothetical protein XYCOK13_00770 [Xylanibacillus composti]